MTSILESCETTSIKLNEDCNYFLTAEMWKDIESGDDTMCQAALDEIEKNSDSESFLQEFVKLVKETISLKGITKGIKYFIYGILMIYCIGVVYIPTDEEDDKKNKIETRKVSKPVEQGAYLNISLNTEAGVTGSTIYNITDIPDDTYKF